VSHTRNRWSSRLLLALVSILTPAAHGEVRLGHALDPSGAIAAGAEDRYFGTGQPFWLELELPAAEAGGAEVDLCIVWSDPEGRVLERALASAPAGTASLSLAAPHTSGWPQGGPYRVEVRRGGPGAAGCAGEVMAFAELGIGRPRESANGHAEPPLPAFPWPPPDPTSETVIAARRLGGGSLPPTLGAAAERLESALRGLGYGRLRFYWIPEGFVLVTRLEQIAEDGSLLPETERWTTELTERDFSLRDLLRLLFVAPEGHYRVLAFLVTSEPIGSAGRPATEEEAGGWLSGGVDRLPEPVAALPFTAGHRCTAYVYQFQKLGFDGEPIVNPPGAPSADTHLERSGILGALGEAP
jgi:hypothetical protein